MANNDLVFSGSIPEIYTRHLGPMLFEPYADHLAGLVAAMAAGNVLETACGTGIVTRALRRALPETTSIVATDLNQPMLDYAQTLSGGERVRWQQADAQALPFANATFDAVVSAFGVMFFPDKPRAYREALRVLRPGGRFVFIVWNNLETMELQFLAHTTVVALYPDDPPAFLRRTPCGYHDIATIRSDLKQAGVIDADIKTVELTGSTASARDAAVGFVCGTPLSGEVSARDPNGHSRAVGAVTDAIAARFGTGSIRASMQAHVVTVRQQATCPSV
jgi:SAM-dependent methyltransferase